MKRRDKRKKRQKRQERVRKPEPSPEPDGRSVMVKRDARGRQYIVAPDGSLRRGDRVNPDKLDWLAGA